MSDHPGDGRERAAGGEASREDRLAEVLASYMDRLNAGDVIEEKEK